MFGFPTEKKRNIFPCHKMYLLSFPEVNLEVTFFPVFFVIVDVKQKLAKTFLVSLQTNLFAPIWKKVTFLLDNFIFFETNIFFLSDARFVCFFVQAYWNVIMFFSDWILIAKVSSCIKMTGFLVWWQIVLIAKKVKTVSYEYQKI